MKEESNKPYHVFTTKELEGKSNTEIIARLKDRVMTCSACCGQRIILNCFNVEDENAPYGWTTYYTVSCGGYPEVGRTGCGHSIAATSWADAINAWNAEIDKELESGDKLDFATEIVFA